MPINLSPGLVMRAKIIGFTEFNGNSLYMNVFNFVNRDFSVPTADDMNSLVASWVADVQSEYLATKTNTYALSRIIVETVADPDRIKIDVGINAPGTRPLGVGGQYLPPFCAKVISWSTGYVSRRYNGKTYMGCALEADQESGVWLEGEPTLFHDLCVDFGTAMLAAYGATGTSDFSLVVLSDPNGYLPATSGPTPPNPGAATIVAGDFYHMNVGTQKRRSIGRGA